MSEHSHCKQPDRDCPNMVCGYPLPCRFHTVILSDGAVMQPAFMKLEKEHIRRLLDLSELLTVAPQDIGLTDE